ncbi:MAG TPA: ABC transporter permease [Acidimicrobiales bacterium]
MTIKDTSPRLRLVASTLLPAALVVAFQIAFFPLPLGVALQGVIIGLLGALVAVGMALVYRANRILNFAQVELGLAPTVLTVSLIAYSGVNYFLAVAVGLVGSLLVGAIVELVIIRRFFHSSRLILTVATIGLSQLLVAGALFLPDIWGQRPTAVIVHLPISLHFTVFPLVFSADHVAAMVVAPIALVGVALLLRYTDIGIAIRASAERADRAMLLGVPVKRLQTIVWAVAAMLSFVAVFLQAGILGLPAGITLSFTVLLAALAALVLGNLTDLPTVAASAVALGVLQQGVLWNHETDPGLVGPVLAAVVVAGLLIRRVRSSRADAEQVSTWAAADEMRPVPRELRALAEVRLVRWATAVLVGGSLLAVPWLLSGNAGNQLKATAVVVFVIITLSVVVLTGWAGQVTLGQMAFVAFGGATGAYATQTWHLDLSLGLLIAGATGAAVAMLVSLPTLRLRGFFPAVTTLAFAIATSSYLLNPQYFSWIPVNRVARPALFGAFRLTSQPSYYYVCLACLLLVTVGVRGVRQSRTGRVLLALRENERGIQSFGVNVMRAKLTAFGLSGFIAGIGGCLLVHLLQAFSPSVFGPGASFEVFTTAVVGGLGSLLGAALGAIYLQGGQWFLPGADWQALTSAAGVLIVLMVIPTGLSDVVFRLRDRWLRSVASRRGIVVPSLVADVGSRAERERVEPVEVVVGDDLRIALPEGPEAGAAGAAAVAGAAAETTAAAGVTVGAEEGSAPP